MSISVLETDSDIPTSVKIFFYAYTSRLIHHRHLGVAGCKFGGLVKKYCSDILFGTKRLTNVSLSPFPSVHIFCTALDKSKQSKHSEARSSTPMIVISLSIYPYSPVSIYIYINTIFSSFMKHLFHLQ